MNNNRSNYAVVNAFDIADLLGRRLARPPDGVMRTLRARDGRVPEWATEAAEAPPGPSGDQLGLGL
jgi:hypothetical protein